MDLYTCNAVHCSKTTTKNYSTSFSMGVRVLKKKYRPAIYAIYGFVRFADEIVDTFHNQDKAYLIEKFRKDTYDAIERKFSSNPILHSFQWVVNDCNITHELINAFLDSMEMDLVMKTHNNQTFKKYVYGSAEVVGLMCQKVFYKGDDEGYKKLLHPARKLGEAFQKVNFLRDIRADYISRGRLYFPNTDFDHFTLQAKQKIEDDIQKDFDEAYEGIKMLKKDARNGVYLAYKYYQVLFKKIQKTGPGSLLEKRYRISNSRKLFLMFSCYVKNALNII